MAYAEVSTPLSSRDAFKRSGDTAVLSQAAALLALGAQLWGDHEVLMARARPAGGEAWTAGIPTEDLDTLGIPALPATAGRINSQFLQQGLSSRYGKTAFPEFITRLEQELPAEILVDLSERLHSAPTTLAAIELMEGCLRHPHELVRVAAASAYYEQRSETQLLFQILEQGLRSTDDLVRDVAATTLALAAPDSHVLGGLTQKSRAIGSAGAASRTCLIIHGTWAVNSPWWQPDGDFHNYLLTGVRPDLYNTADAFFWSGGYSDQARQIAADDVSVWVKNRGLNGLDLFCHSHGGSVAMLATYSGLEIGTLVLLSCPVHVPKYSPDFSKLKRAISIRVHLDLVILADRGGQRFRLPQIEETDVLPLWFDHTATHNPDIWEKYKVPQVLKGKGVARTP